MLRVDRNQNPLSRLTPKKFGDLALRKRDHLQQWLVHPPAHIRQLETAFSDPLPRRGRSLRLQDKDAA